MGEDHVMLKWNHDHQVRVQIAQLTAVLSSDYECTVCGEPGGNWIECKSCEKW